MNKFATFLIILFFTCLLIASCHKLDQDKSSREPYYSFYYEANNRSYYHEEFDRIGTGGTIFTPSKYDAPRFGFTSYKELAFSFLDREGLYLDVLILLPNYTEIIEKTDLSADLENHFRIRLKGYNHYLSTNNPFKCWFEIIDDEIKRYSLNFEGVFVDKINKDTLRVKNAKLTVYRNITETKFENTVTDGNGKEITFYKTPYDYRPFLIRKNN